MTGDNRFSGVHVVAFFLVPAVLRGWDRHKVVQCLHDFGFVLFKAWDPWVVSEKDGEWGGLMAEMKANVVGELES